MTPGRHTPVHLNALRAFEAAARLRSFVAAAAELSVTPSAISQQVRTLEDYLGVKLFVRNASGVAPTPEALAAYPDVQQGLGYLAAALGKMQGDWRDDVVTLTVPISFAARWLLPRIERFRAAHPGLDLRLDTSNRLSDFVAEGIDLGVRYGHGTYPGLVAEKLLDETVFPVCSPRLLTDTLAPGVDWLRSATLIHDGAIDFDPTYPGWPAWLAAHGFAGIDDSRGLRFNSTVLALQAAVDGLGVALGRSVAVADDLQAGRLVRPFDGALATRCAYHVVHLRNGLAHRHVRAVRDWLFAEAAGGVEQN